MSIVREHIRRSIRAFREGRFSDARFWAYTAWSQTDGNDHPKATALSSRARRLGRMIDPYLHSSIPSL